MLDVSAGLEKPKRCIRLVIADPQPIVLHGLRSVFATQHDFEIVASCGCGADCLEAIRNLVPDVALVAGTLPDLTASQILAIAKAENLPTRLMFFADCEGDDHLAASVAAGICNAVSPYADPDTILCSLRLATEGAGAPPKPSGELSSNENGGDNAKIEKMLGALTHRERQIVQLVSEGLSNKEIARELNVSRGTVKVHLYNIFQKLEVSNRTVLATIALLQRSTGFTTLSLALTLAMLSDVKTSDASDIPPDDDGTLRKHPEHSVLEFWKKTVLRRDTAADSGETVGQKDLSSREIKVTHPAERMEAAHAAEQASFSSIARSYGPIGSSALSLSVSPLQQSINHRQAGNLTTQQPFPSPAFAPDPVRSGGYGISAITAGIGIVALDSSHAAVQALRAGEMPIDAAAAAAQDGIAQAINIHVASKVDSDVDHPASDPVVHGSQPSAAFGASGQHSAAGAGHAGQIIHDGARDDARHGDGPVNVIGRSSGGDTVEGNRGDDTLHGGSGSDTISGNGATAVGHGADRLTSGHGDGSFVYLSAADSHSRRFDTIDFTSGSDRINLAAFGALAFLHLTSASQPVPPHTLAWIYNSVSNETIVYLNPTDHSLDIGDAGLLEIHLQGIASVAEADFVYQPDAAAVVVALDGIDPALQEALASDGTALTTDGTDVSIEKGASDALGTAGAWTVPAEDGLRFHFGRDRDGSSGSIRLTSFDDSDNGTNEQQVGAVVVPTQISSIEPAYGHTTVLTNENPAFKTEPGHSNNGAETIGHGNPHATAGLEFFDFSTPVVTPVAAETVEPDASTGNGRAHGNSQHPANAASSKGSAADEPADPVVAPGNSGHNNPHASDPAVVESGAAPSNGAGHGKSERPAHSVSSKALVADEPADPVAASGNNGHTNLHGSHPAAKGAVEVADPVAPGDAPGNGVGHGNSEHPSHSASVKPSAADEPADSAVASGNNGHDNPHVLQPAAKGAVEVAQPVVLGAAPGNGAGHGNSEHPSHSASVKPLVAADEPADPAVASGNNGHDNPHASLPAATSAVEVAEPLEPGTPGNGAGHGNSKQASKVAVESPSVAAEPTDPGDTPGHGNSQLPSSGASVSTMETAGGDHGNSPQVSNTASVKTSVPTPPVNPAPGAGPESSFHFNNETSSSSPSAVVALTEFPDTPIQGAELTAILETDPAPMEVHGNGHVQSVQHHAVAHLHHELLP
jgi:VCBS repeat-containing protein